MAHPGYRPLAGGSPTARPLPGLVPERLRMSARTFDACFAAALTLLMLAVSAALFKHASGRAVIGELAITGACGTALAWRRTASVPVLAFQSAAVLAEGVLGLTLAASVGVVVACYSVSSVSSRRTAAIAGVAASVVLGLSRLVHAGVDDAFIISSTLAVSAACVLGLYIGTRRAYVEALGERAARLEREHALVAERVVSQERARIAREMHDVVAHHVSLMVVQGAAVSETLGEAHPLSPTLEALASTGRQALGEMRRMLGLLRADGDVEHAPQPGLAQLGELAGQLRLSGLDVQVREPTGPLALPPGVELSVYRIAQEALTNALRHGQATRATVHVRHEPDALVVEIIDDGRGAAAPVSVGHGLVGMRERVALYDGSLEAGPGAAGGYAVRATFPLTGTA